MAKIEGMPWELVEPSEGEVVEMRLKSVESDLTQLFPQLYAEMLEMAVGNVAKEYYNANLSWDNEKTTMKLTFPDSKSAAEFRKILRETYQ